MCWLVHNEKIMKKGILKVPADVISSMEEACKTPPGLSNVGRDETLFDEEYKFDDGMRMVIQVVASTDPDTESCWVQGVLIDEEGWEHGCTDVGESFAGEYCVGDYCVNVEPATFVIRNIKNKLYWSNDWGWGSLEGCETFDTKALNLPVDGEWVEQDSATEVEDN